jgi:hypothetical protein
VVQLLDQLIEGGCIEQTSLDPGRPLIRLSELGESVMRGQAELDVPIQLPRTLSLQTGHDTPSFATDDLPVDAEVLQALKAWRSDQAEKNRLPPHYVLPNSTLEELAARRPQSRASLLEIKGIGEKKIDRYGEALLEMLGAAVAEASPSESVHQEDSLVRETMEAEPRSEAKTIEETQPERPPAFESQNGQGQPDFYWTLRLLEKGFTAAECARIRGRSDEEIVEHALQAAEAGESIVLDRVLSAEQITAMRRLIGTATPSQIGPLLEYLPHGTGHEHVRLYLKCRP